MKNSNFVGFTTLFSFLIVNALILSGCALFIGEGSLKEFYQINNIPEKIICDVPANLANVTNRSIEKDVKTISGEWTSFSMPRGSVEAGYRMTCELAFFATIADWYETDLAVGETRKETVMIGDDTIEAARSLVQAEFWDRTITHPVAGKMYKLTAKRVAPSSQYEKAIEIISDGAGGSISRTYRVEWTIDRNRIKASGSPTANLTLMNMYVLEYNHSENTFHLSNFWTQNGEWGIQDQYLHAESGTEGAVLAIWDWSTQFGWFFKPTIAYTDGEWMVGYSYHDGLLGRGVDRVVYDPNTYWYDFISSTGEEFAPIPAGFPVNLFARLEQMSGTNLFPFNGSNFYSPDVLDVCPKVVWLNDTNLFSGRKSWVAFSRPFTNYPSGALVFNVDQANTSDNFLGVLWSWGGDGSACIVLPPGSAWEELGTVYLYPSTLYSNYSINDVIELDTSK